MLVASLIAQSWHIHTLDNGGDCATRQSHRWASSSAPLPSAPVAAFPNLYPCRRALGENHPRGFDARRAHTHTHVRTCLLFSCIYPQRTLFPFPSIIEAGACVPPQSERAHYNMLLRSKKKRVLCVCVFRPHKIYYCECVSRIRGHARTHERCWERISHGAHWRGEWKFIIPAKKTSTKTTEYDFPRELRNSSVHPRWMLSPHKPHVHCSKLCVFMFSRMRVFYKIRLGAGCCRLAHAVSDLKIVLANREYQAWVLFLLVAQTRLPRIMRAAIFAYIKCTLQRLLQGAIDKQMISRIFFF